MLHFCVVHPVFPHGGAFRRCTWYHGLTPKMDPQNVVLKQTINLPTTAFSMKANLPQAEPETDLVEGFELVAFEPPAMLWIAKADVIGQSWVACVCDRDRFHFPARRECDRIRRPTI